MDYNQVLEKLKDIRKIVDVIINDTRSGSGEIVLEHFNLLNQVYGGTPSAAKDQQRQTLALLQVSSGVSSFEQLDCKQSDADDVYNESADEYTEEECFQKITKQEITN